MFSPLFYYYPEDSETYQFVENKFMVGDQIKVVPVLKAGVDPQGQGFQSYFPLDVWVNLFDFSKIIDTRSSKFGQYELIQTTGNHVIAHIKGGSVVPW